MSNEQTKKVYSLLIDNCSLKKSAVIFCGTGCPGPIGQSFPLGSRVPCVARTFLPARICVGRGGGVAHCEGKGTP